MPVANAKEVADIMKASIRARGIHDIEVVFFEAEILDTIDPVETLHEELAWEKPVKVGVSIGSGPDNPGILGCFVIIAKGRYVYAH